MAVWSPFTHLETGEPHYYHPDRIMFNNWNLFWNVETLNPLAIVWCDSFYVTCLGIFPLLDLPVLRLRKKYARQYKLSVVIKIQFVNLRCDESAHQARERRLIKHKTQRGGEKFWWYLHPSLFSSNFHYVNTDRAQWVACGVCTAYSAVYRVLYMVYWYDTPSGPGPRESWIQSKSTSTGQCQCEVWELSILSPSRLRASQHCTVLFSL